MEIKSVEEFANLVRSGYKDWSSLGEIIAREDKNLIIFNYTNAAIYKREWNFVERICRGLIIDKVTGEIVARPFDKFFNLNEFTLPDSKLIYASEKIDGSLGILYRDKGSFKIASRGSFESDQAIRATYMLNYKYGFKDSYLTSPIPQQWTLLFEIVYPENRIVVDYKDEIALYLLAIRNRFTGTYVNTYDVLKIAAELGFKAPNTFIPYSLEQITGALPKIPYNQEGWVLEFEDGTRIKAKGEEYLKVHRIIYNLTPKNILESIVDGSIQTVLDTVPDEFADELLRTKEWIENRFIELKNEINEHFELAPKDTRKNFALWVTKNTTTLRAALFLKLDNRDYNDEIWKIIGEELKCQNGNK